MLDLLLLKPGFVAMTGVISWRATHESFSTFRWLLWSSLSARLSSGQTCAKFSRSRSLEGYSTAMRCVHAENNC
jgi:hypothetical protein